jgi:hypothetical protein
MHVAHSHRGDKVRRDQGQQRGAAQDKGECKMTINRYIIGNIGNLVPDGNGGIVLYDDISDTLLAYDKRLAELQEKNELLRYLVNRMYSSSDWKKIISDIEKLAGL